MEGEGWGTWSSVGHYIELSPGQLASHGQELLAVEHLRTTLKTTHASLRHSGSTDWKVRLAPGWVELSWGWVEISSEIVVMSDPNSIASTVRMVEGGKEVTDFPVYALLMNLLVHAIEWQPTVCAEIRRFKGRVPLVPGAH